MENIIHKEFKIDTLKDETFRVSTISPVEMLAISTQINFENLQMTKALIQFCLENVEVKIGEKWLPVKVRDKEIYQPVGIEMNMKALNEIFTYMVSDVIVPTFMNSNE